ncbi:Membrane fusogenic activity [compost metagenome]
MDLVRRDEFDVLKDEIAALRAEIAELKTQKSPANKASAGTSTGTTPDANSAG